jgi:hypothetical protein
MQAGRDEGLARLDAAGQAVAEGSSCPQRHHGARRLRAVASLEGSLKLLEPIGASSPSRALRVLTAGVLIEVGEQPLQ